MREMSVREVNQNLSRVIAAAERGVPTLITKNGKVVAKLVPHGQDKSADPHWRAAFAAMQARWAAKVDDGFRVGTITDEDLHGDTP